jgi:hypothetical protein
MQNRFIDPATGDTYDWEANHSDEQELVKARNMTYTAPTGLVGLVKQQGANDPVILKFTGTISKRSMFQTMLHWYHLCAEQTIHFRDFDGEVYEVQITHFAPTRHRNLYRADRTNHQHYWTYEIELEVYKFIDGDYADAGIGP